jgi:hypothetical protein
LRGINAVKTKKDNSIGLGDWVKYKRAAPEGSVKVTCSQHLLQVLEFRSGGESTEALVKRSTWAEGLWIQLKHLVFAQAGEIAPPTEYSDEDLEDMAESGFTHMPEEDDKDDEVPFIEVESPQTPKEELKKGDRVISQVSGKEGEVTKINSRYTYIQWTKPEGVPAVQYLASDLEIMRVEKAVGEGLISPRSQVQLSPEPFFKIITADSFQRRVEPTRLRYLLVLARFNVEG